MGRTSSRQVTSGDCYRGEGGGPSVKYQCHFWDPELRHLPSEDDDEMRTDNVNSNIMIALVSIVYIIGMALGYLMYRKRKQSTDEIMLLSDDANHTSVLTL